MTQDDEFCSKESVLEAIKAMEEAAYTRHDDMGETLKNVGEQMFEFNTGVNDDGYRTPKAGLVDNGGYHTLQLLRGFKFPQLKPLYQKRFQMPLLKYV